MKNTLMSYCQRAHAAAMASEAYSYAAGYQMGMTSADHYVKNTVMSKYEKTVVFPPNVGLLPVAVFSIGVTKRLVTVRTCSFMLRMLMALASRANETGYLRPLPKSDSADQEANR